MIDIKKLTKYDNRFIKMIDNKIPYETKTDREIRDTILHIMIGNYKLIWFKKEEYLKRHNNEIILDEKQKNDLIYNET